MVFGAVAYPDQTVPEVHLDHCPSLGGDTCATAHAPPVETPETTVLIALTGIPVLASYPLPVSTPQEAAQLDGVGDYLAGFFGRVILNRADAPCHGGAVTSDPAPPPSSSWVASIGGDDSLEAGSPEECRELSAEAAATTEAGCRSPSSCGPSTALEVYLQRQRRAAERLAAFFLKRHKDPQSHPVPGREGFERCPGPGRGGEVYEVRESSGANEEGSRRTHDVAVSERAGGEQAELEEDRRDAPHKDPAKAGVSGSLFQADLSSSENQTECVHPLETKGVERRQKDFRKGSSAWTGLVCLYRLKAFGPRGVSRMQIKQEQEDLSKVYPCSGVSGSVLESLRVDQLIAVRRPCPAAVRAASATLAEQKLISARVPGGAPRELSSANQAVSEPAGEPLQAGVLNGDSFAGETALQRCLATLQKGEDSRAGEGREASADSGRCLAQKAPRQRRADERETLKLRLLKKCCHDHLELLFLTPEGEEVAKRLVEEVPELKRSSTDANSCVDVEALPPHLEKEQAQDLSGDQGKSRSLKETAGSEASSRGNTGAHGFTEGPSKLRLREKHSPSSLDEGDVSVESSSAESDANCKRGEDPELYPHPFSWLPLRKRRPQESESKDASPSHSHGACFHEPQATPKGRWRQVGDGLSSEGSLGEDAASATPSSTEGSRRLCRASGKSRAPVVVLDEEDEESNACGALERQGTSCRGTPPLGSPTACVGAATPVRRRADNRRPLTPAESPSVPAGFPVDHDAKESRRNAVAAREWSPVGHTFQVRLVLDNRERVEHGGGGWGGGMNRAEFLSSQLRRNGVPVELRPLPVGDALWVAQLRSVPAESAPSPHPTRERTPEVGSTAGSSSKPVEDREGHGAGSEGASPCKKGAASSPPVEFVLPIIVERKTLRDLSSSIRDGRYEDQKYRLMRCAGVTRVLYLVEGLLEASQCPAIPLSAATFAAPKRNPAGTTPSPHRVPGSQRPGILGGSPGPNAQGGGRTFLGGPLSTSAATTAAEIAAVRTAQVKTQLVNGFLLLNTTCPAHTVAMLTRIHRRLVRQFASDAVIPVETGDQICSEGISRRGAEAALGARGAAEAEFREGRRDVQTPGVETEMSVASASKDLGKVTQLFLRRKRMEQAGGLSGVGGTFGMSPWGASGTTEVVELLSWSAWLETNRQSAKYTVQEVFCRQLSVLPFLGKRGAAHIAKACGHPAAFARLLAAHPDDRRLRAALAAAAHSDQGKRGTGSCNRGTGDDENSGRLLQTPQRQNRPAGDETGDEDRHSASEDRESGGIRRDGAKRKRREGRLARREQGRVSAVNTGTARPQAISSKALALCRLLYQEEVPATVLDQMQPLAHASSALLEGTCSAATPSRDQMERGNIL
ncbi:Conserved possible MUS81 endonuclease, related [Neospora caninum Liverpool]|uniref:Crossover junction endonuclease MUS81 n=1 Tax=Neospora caninum (strain Liverpool) TaxID=572307 RepID=F0VGF5_NEOCL|nr:Conserved possible MUS81 endonuclease, related [Neospora caninum Liverpool]CBZ52799.1 Conserved possible MUS81 endonuclease, related [Neospora caninum Liverpool]|eukprot:XP_003882831.1 Conserved possible MUS81 endonuclease, related [Neospora caninum Liverpool]